MIIPMYTPHLPYQSADMEALVVLYILVPSQILCVAMTPIGVSKTIFNLVCLLSSPTPMLHRLPLPIITIS